MSTVLGIDLGTQAVKVVVYDADSRDVVAVESAPLDLYQADGGVAEQQAHWWLDALRQALGQVGSRVRESIAAVGVSGQQHGFVPVDGAGEVQAPVKLWCDTSTSEECDEITAAYGGRDALIREVGNPILPGYTASKVRWFRNTHPGQYARMRTILLPHDYLNYVLTGEFVMEFGDASGTGWLDVRQRNWSTKVLEAIDPGRALVDCLPALVDGRSAIGQLTSDAAERFGLPAGVPVSAGGGDNMMGALGTGNVRPGVVTMSLGTSGTVYAFSDTPIVDSGGNIAAFCSSNDGWLPLLCTMNCTVATESMRKLLDTDLAGFEAMLGQSQRGAEGVLTVPFFNGERTPNLPNARACVFGFDARNARPENLLRSAVEGATYALRFGIDELKALGIQASEIILTGGGSNSGTWRQVVADICNAPVTVLEQTEGAALGAALQALSVSPGNESTVEELAAENLTANPHKSVEPRQSAVTFYNDRYASYQRAVDRVADLYP